MFNSCGLSSLQSGKPSKVNLVMAGQTFLQRGDCEDLVRGKVRFTAHICLFADSLQGSDKSFHIFIVSIASPGTELRGEKCKVGISWKKL